MNEKQNNTNVQTEEVPPISTQEQRDYWRYEHWGETPPSQEQSGTEEEREHDPFNPQPTRPNSISTPEQREHYGNGTGEEQQGGAIDLTPTSPEPISTPEQREYWQNEYWKESTTMQDSIKEVASTLLNSIHSMDDAKEIDGPASAAQKAEVSSLKR